MMCQPHFRLLSQRKTKKKKKQKVLAFTSWEISPIYRAWFANIPLILGIESINFRDKIRFSLSRIDIPKNKGLETRKPVDEYLFGVFSAFVCLSIMNFPYAVGWPALLYAYP